MKNFKTLLQNACEDYFASLDHEPTIADVKAVCETQIASVVWDALHRANHTRHFATLDQDHTRDILKRVAHEIIGKPVIKCSGTIKHIFSCANNYGFIFEFATQLGTHHEPIHTSNPEITVTGYTIRSK